MSEPKHSCKDCDSLTRKLIQVGPRTYLCLACKRARKLKKSTSAHTSRMQRDYKLSPGEYNKLLEAQGGKCYTCGPWTNNRGLSRRLSVDHDHSCCPEPPICGKCIRGLICTPCNDLIGQVGDSRGHAFERLQAYVDYLKNPPAQLLLEEIRKKKTDDREADPFGAEGVFGA